MDLYNQGLQNIVSGLQNYGRAAEMQQEKQRLATEREEAKKAQENQLAMTMRQKAMQYSQQGLNPAESQALVQYEVSGEMTPDAQNALQKFTDYASQRRQSEMDAMRSKATSAKKPSLSEAEKTYEREAGKKLAEYQLGGGKEQVESNIGKLENAIARLEQKDELTGGFLQRLPFGSSDYAIDVTNPELASVRDDVRSAIQDTLRATLGPQFTEKEGERIFNMAFNPRLSDAENIKRARGVSNYLKTLAGNKDQALKYFKENKTLAGFNPQSFQREMPQNVNPAQQFAGQGVLLPGVNNIPTNVPIQNQIIPSATANGNDNDFINMLKTPEGMSALDQELSRRKLKKR